jgi:hypothetical protein
MYYKDPVVGADKNTIYSGYQGKWYQLFNMISWQNHSFMYT